MFFKRVHCDVLEAHLISMCLTVQIVFTPYDSIDLVDRDWGLGAAVSETGLWCVGC